MEERDVSGEMQRSQMEEISTDTFNRIERTLRAIVHNASKYNFNLARKQKWSEIAFIFIHSLFWCSGILDVLGIKLAVALDNIC